MSGAKIPLPSSFDFTTPESWPSWKNRFERFRSLTKLDHEPEERQISSLLYAMGEESENIFEALPLSESDRKKWTQVIQTLDNYFQPSINVIHQRTLFEQCVQLPTETVEEFVRRLRLAAKYCQFDKPDERIRDRLVAHMVNKEVSKKLQLKDHDTLTLNEAISIARKTERVDGELRMQATHAAQATQAAAVTQIHPNRPQKPQRQSRMEQQNSDSSKHSRGGCRWCGSPTDHKANRDKCPAKTQTCYVCRKQGHFATVCRFASSHAAHSVTENPALEDFPTTDTFLGGATLDSAEIQHEQWTATLGLGGSQVNFKIDTGADISIVTRETYQNLNDPPALQPFTSSVTGPAGEKLPIQGQFYCTVDLNGRKYPMKIVVLASGGNNLLSRDMSSKMGLVKRTQCLLAAKSPIGCMLDAPAKIELKPDSTPYNCITARRVPIPLMSKVKTELERMVREGIIEVINKPTDWCAPMVPVLKPSGDVRICIDLKKLNACVKREHYPLPTVDDTLAKLRGSTVFTTLDTTSGFWQIPLEEESAELTTFITPFGRYKFKRLPFGITSAPELFQRRLQELLSAIPNCAVFIDDIIVFGNTISNHDAALVQVQARLQSAGLTLNPNKCHYRQSSLKYLGHQISAKGVGPDPDKLKAISQLKSPSDADELRRALGLFNFLSKFLPALATVAAPLRDLLRKGVPWVWTSSHDKAFCELKQLAAEAPCLSYFDPLIPTVITADASGFGLGGALLQFNDNRWTPVAYTSRTMTIAEKRYAQIEKELLASVWCCEHFRQYLYGAPQFVVQTDHKPLVPLINSRDLDKVPIRCQRLLIRLLRFDVRAEYVPGKDMIIADTLSRAPLSSTVTGTELHEESEATISCVVSEICSASRKGENWLEQRTMILFLSK